MRNHGTLWENNHFFFLHIVQSIFISNLINTIYAYRMFLYFIEEITRDKMKDILRIQKASSKIDIMKFSFYHRFLFCSLSNEPYFLFLFLSRSLSLSPFLVLFVLYIQFLLLFFHPIKREEQNTWDDACVSITNSEHSSILPYLTEEGDEEEKR